MESSTKASEGNTSWQGTGFIINVGSLYSYLTKLTDS